MKAKPKSQTPGADVASHPTLWGHPLPVWSDNGLVYTGTHWTENIYEDLIIWMGRSLDAIKHWIYGPVVHRKYLIQHKRISIACAKAREQDTGEKYNNFAKAVDAILPTIILTKDEHDRIEDQVAYADRARSHLWSIANTTSPKTRPNTIDELAQWVTGKRADLLLRLAQVGLIPRPPDSIIPKTLPTRVDNGPSRHAKLTSKATADPEMEAIF